jgi:phage baseplate assembly protein W
MPTFIGYNTIDQYKKFTLVDFPLIKRDLLNAFNIRQGEIVGKPAVGTVMWNLIFEPQAAETVSAIEAEVQRVVAQDPRVVVTSMNVYPQLNGILIEIEVQTVAGSNAEVLSVFFNQQTRRASYV